MIAPLLEILRPTIEALPWVGRFGGVVRTVSRPVVIETDGLPQIIMQSFPISCNVTATDCWENNLYLDLVPNDNYKSVCYFEDKQGLRLNGEGKNGGVEFTAQVRFVAWLNTKALGYDDCHFADYVAATMLNTLKKQDLKCTIPFPCVLQIEPSTYEPRGKNLFEGYAYQDEQKLLFYPYDYFAINLEVKIWTDYKCLPEYVIKAPNSCQ